MCRNLRVASVVADFPAYKVIKREIDSRSWYVFSKKTHIPFTDIVVGDRLGLLCANGCYDEFYPGSVVSYALKNCHDPIESIDKARKLGHELHWINSCSTVLTSHPMPQEFLVAVEIGMAVRFEGLLFTIESAPNHNLRLQPVKDSIE